MIGEIIGAGIKAGSDAIINATNLDFQEKQNAITREREDNAVQRRATVI